MHAWQFKDACVHACVRACMRAAVRTHPCPHGAKECVAHVCARAPACATARAHRAAMTDAPLESAEHVFEFCAHCRITRARHRALKRNAHVCRLLWANRLVGAALAQPGYVGSHGCGGMLRLPRAATWLRCVCNAASAAELLSVGPRMPRPIGQVDLVAQQRVADVLHVHADLMCPARRASAARCTRPDGCSARQPSLRAPVAHRARRTRWEISQMGQRSHASAPPALIDARVALMQCQLDGRSMRRRQNDLRQSARA